MSLVFAAFVPHSPLLLPSVGRENTEKLKKTTAALHTLEQELYLAKPDTVIVISGHGPVFPDAFSMNINPSYRVNLSEFGDVTTAAEFSCDMGFALTLKEDAKTAGIPLTLQTQETLDYGAAVPLLLLTAHVSTKRIVPIGFSQMDSKAHFNFGYLLKDRINSSSERYAIIASGDLSHCLSSGAPGGFKPEGEKFEETVVKALENKNTTSLLQIDAKEIETVAECGVRALWILLGALQRVNFDVKILAHESPFGVGHLTAQFKLL